jgi:tRNA pseudouridine38-40 synthase
VSRVMMVLEYDGGVFHGWQRQKDVRTVQGELERVLATVLGESVTVTGAGRTDAGCHATHQVASFATGGGMPLDRLARALNGLLRGEVVVKDIAPAAEGFNARFSAVSRTYRYSIARSPTALFRDRVWIVQRPLDASAMAEGASLLAGAWDFSGFAKGDRGGDRNPVSRVLRAGWSEWELGLAFKIEADRFIQGMVRTIVGTMVRIGTGRIPPGCVKEILEGSGALRGGPCAPARGLCLVDVKYGPNPDARPGATISARRQRNEVLP